MLFNSYEFLFFFFPATLAGFLALSKFQHLKAAAAWLALASVFFYGYWSPRYVVLLMVSIGLNFWAGQLIASRRNSGQLPAAKAVLLVALVGNLVALGYFKYANFFVTTFNSATGLNLFLGQIILPIGISFFTFTQIAYLVDTHQGKVREAGFVPYVLFVTFFPHLIAGPVLHHAEMMPQFARSETFRFNLNNFLVGAGFFAIGLFKKVVLADGIQPYVGPVFEADPSQTVTLLEAWGGVLAYTLQLYFDFSGYSDMAIGLSKMVNIDLPINFNSPYKATNISEFWRRWHMTLSRFLRDYLYVPLGGNRKGVPRRYMNLMATMLLGGLWHGAGWTFVIWGGLHGLYLVVHQLWQAFREKVLNQDLNKSTPTSNRISALTTFICVVVAWVFFRATHLDAAIAVLKGMAGLNGAVMPLALSDWFLWLGVGVPAGTVFGHMELLGGTRQLAWTAALLAMVWFMPNSQQMMGKLMLDKLQGSGAVRPRTSGLLQWTALGAIGFFVFLLAAINGSHGSSEFIYFNF